MKVCLYLEFERRIKVSGVKSAFQMHQKALRAAGVPFTLDPRTPHDIFHPYFPGLRSYLLMHHAKRVGTRVVTHAHVTAEDFRHTYLLSTMAYPFVRGWLKRFYQQGEVILVPSSYTGDLLRTYGITTPMRVLSNGVDLEVFKSNERKRKQYRERYRLEGTVVFSVGWVFARKGVSSFARIAKQFEGQASFVWFGQFTRQKLLPDLPFEQRARNLLFTGYVPDIVAAFAAGDIFFFPSYEENQGIVILEAAALGKPIVVRDIPAYRGWLEHNMNCLKGKTDEELACALERVLHDPALRLALGANARKLASAHSLPRIGAQLKEVYTSLL